MDEENKQITGNGVYSYGETTEKPEEKGEESDTENSDQTQTESTDSQENKFAYQDNRHANALSPVSSFHIDGHYPRKDASLPSHGIA